MYTSRKRSSLPHSKSAYFIGGWRTIGAVCIGLGSSFILHAADGQPVAPPFSRAQVEFYEKQVQPILSQHCYKCHSHESEKIKGSLVLDSREGLLAGGDTGPAVIPGDPDKSLLLKAVRHEDEDLQMPPKSKLTDLQIAVLVEWVRMNAPYPDSHLAQSPAPGKKRATTTDRNWWSYQPLQRAPVPKVEDHGWSRNPVDKFVFEKLTTEHLAPAPEADKRALIRRVYLDVIGLPPGFEEAERFVSDRSTNAYEKVIEKLLSSPQYGEKWARHWLDLVRYAESDGFKLDAFRPSAWRYRDYVIRSFNEDKPYNRFLMEQIAADELWPEDPAALVAVSYLRLPIYEYNQRDVKAQWASTLNDITDVTADAFLGVGMQCARCHDHKFDPILQRDYYRLQAFFAPISPRDDVPLAAPDQVKAYQMQLANWKEATADIRAQIEEIERPVREKTAKGVIDKFPKDIQAVMKKPAGERTPYEQQINDLAYRQVKDELVKLDGKFSGADREKLAALQTKLAKYDDLKPKPLPEAMLVSDIGREPPPVTIPKSKSKTPIEPGFLTLLGEAPARIEPAPGHAESTGRRAALAKWLGEPGNRFTARVMANRIWQRHFGRGLVATLNDFGHLGEPPTHPELLDWLAEYFVEHGWSIKEMHRLVLTSATYRQSAEGTAGAAVDAENRWLWRQNLRRLESDQIRDAMLLASGELDPATGGPSVDPSKPRRTIYTKWLRNSHDPLLEAFDPPDAYISSPQRNITTTPMQSLVMLNGSYALQRAQVLAERIKGRGLSNSAEFVSAAYRLVYGRNPSDTERQTGESFLQEQAKRIATSGAVARVLTDTLPGHSGAAAVFKPNGLQTRLLVPDNHLMPQYDFTVEAFVLLRSVDNGGEPRTIVSRWDGRKNQPGWSLGVTGSKSEGGPRNLILELIGDTAEDGTSGYETIAPSLQLELDTPYFVAASVRIGDTTETGVSFYLKELTAGAAVRAAHVAHKVTADTQSNLPLVIGGRDPEKHQAWDGLIDDVRVSNRALKQDELLLTREAPGEGTVGYWRFEEPDFFKDSSPNGHNIKREISPAGQSDPQTAALIDFCHALLNSSEFLYTD